MKKYGIIQSAKPMKENMLKSLIFNRTLIFKTGLAFGNPYIPQNLLEVDFSPAAGIVPEQRLTGIGNTAFEVYPFETEFPHQRILKTAVEKQIAYVKKTW